jgi:predicted metal-dependent hydrolase
MKSESPAPDVPAAVRRGVRLFNRRRYLSAHQVWEAAWYGAASEDRGFLEGLVQVATGLHLRTRRGATRGAVNLLARSLVTLDDYRPAAHGVDVERLVADLSTFVDWLRAIKRPHRALDRLRLPRIH